MRAPLPEFDIALTRRLGNSSLHAYDPIEDLKSRGAIPIYDPAFDILATIESLPDCTILSYRGTRSLQNWKVDLKTRPNKEGIHTGFHDAFQSIDKLVEKVFPQENILYNKLTHSFERSKPLYVTGHSLGGALAVLGAVHYHADALVAFGQPRVFTYKYLRRNGYKLKAINYWRVVDKEDIVPRVPGILGGYHHRGQLALIDDYCKLEINPPEIKQLVGHIKGIAADLFRVFMGRLPQWIIIREHAMSEYMAGLNQIV